MNGPDPTVRWRCPLDTVQRTQVYLDEKVTAVIDARARRERRTRSEVIRELMAAYAAEEIAEEQELIARQKAVILAGFGAEPDLVGTTDVERETDLRRQDEIDARWDAPR